VDTGRFFVDALKRGADAYGIDISKNMLERLKSKIPAQDHRRLWVHDAVTMHLPLKFSLIIAPFRVFSHLKEVEDQVKCLNSVWDHLEPGGRFIFDVCVPDFRLLEGMHNHPDFEGEYEPGKKL